MGILTLTLPDGRTGNLSVDDSFASMSDAQKSDFISHVRDQVEPHASFSSDLQGGLHDLGNAASTGAQAVGVGLNALGLSGQDTANSIAKGIQGVTPDEPVTAPVNPIEDIKSGNYGQALSDAAHTAVRGAVGAVPIIAGGLLGGPAGAFAGGAAEALGPTAAARAAANNRPMTGADVAGAIPGAALQGAAATLLPGSGAASDIANPILRAGARAALAATGMGGMTAAGQAGSTLGTQQGLTMDPEAIGNAALAGGVMGGATGAGELARDSIKAGSDQLMARTMPMPDADTGASIVRSVNAIKGVQAQRAAAGQPVADNIAADSVKGAYVDRLKSFASGLMTAELIDKPDYNQLQTAIDAAQRHNNTLSTGQLDHIDGLDIDPTYKNFLKQNLQDLNTVSTQSFLKNQTGPFTKAGGVFGTAAAIAAGAHAGPGGIMAALAMKSPSAALGRGVGGMVDRAFGTNTAPIMLQRINADRALRAVGIDPSSVTAMDAPQLPAAAPQTPLVTGQAARMGLIRQMQAQSAARQAPAPADATPNPIAGLMAAKREAMARQAQLDAQSASQQVTGNAPDAVPVNTPIRASVPVPQQSPLAPSLVPDTPQSVKSTIAADNMGAGQPTGPLQAPPAVPAPTTAPAPQAAPTGSPGGALGYVLAPRPDLTPEHALAAARAVGIPDLANMPIIDRALARKVQAALPPVAGMEPTGGNQGYAVERSIQARVNAAGAQMRLNTYAQAAYARGDKELGDTFQAIAAEKTISGKQAIAQAYEASHPGETIPPDTWAIGKKG